MNKVEKHELPLERVLFFGDAIVAIAITLLALELKINVPEGQPLRYSDLLRPWHQYLAFLLSFINISNFWSLHYRLFIYINKMDDRLKAYNTFWLFFIVVLPFSTGVLSDHFGANAAVLLYTLNITLVAVFQRLLWAYSVKYGLANLQVLDAPSRERIDIFLNLDLFNGLASLVISFFAPVTAFVLLFFKVPLILVSFVYMARLRRKQQGERPAHDKAVE